MKHAYLILAHRNWGQMKVLLSLLDDARNDIYIHFDNRNLPTKYEIHEMISGVLFSKVYFVDSNPVYWGSYSIVEAEFSLLKASVKGHYDYYHLLSGMDLPLKTQNEIHRFFEENNGKEFIQFCWDQWQKDHEHRYRYYWFFQEKIERNQRTIWNAMNKLSLTIQKLVGLKRQSGFTVVTGGSQWFSITDDLTRYICEKEKVIKKRFRFTLIPDECFMQTCVADSKFFQRVYKHSGDKYIESNMRFIDWIHGAPYTFQIGDFQRIMDSGCLFARKFDETIDRDIIYKIQDLINSKCR